MTTYIAHPRLQRVRATLALGIVIAALLLYPLAVTAVIGYLALKTIAF